MSLLQQNKPTLTDILREHNIDRMCNVAKRLLDDQVFHLTLRAKIRFPELFDVSPAQSAEREASEAEAARDEAKAVREISERETPREVTIQSQVRPANEESYEINGWYSYERIFAIFVDSQHHQPLRLKLVSIIQSHLSIQSTYITEVSTSSQQAYKDWWKKLVLSTLKVTSRSFWQEMAGTAQRLWNSPSGPSFYPERLAQNAQVFLEALDDSNRSQRVSMLRRELSMAIEELKRKKDFLEGRYLGELKEIQAKRAALDMWEQNAKNAMINGDSQCLDDTDKILARAVQYLSPDEGKGKMPIECPELSDSDEEFLESVVAVNSSGSQALQVARSSESL
ncbi:hypothetical protein IFM60648_08488 [Aspergillus lentulus]|uniref:Uncharacterized protein n=1 Tax=Aspergillus lentulus TaxID=293939 RepID=A0ABQ1AVC7_ASPLE|nr:hypothetical protein IFM60648_08488 [Aspergillus lentulus]